MKKLNLFVLAALMVAFAACKADKDNEPQNQAQDQENDEATKTSPVKQYADASLYFNNAFNEVSIAAVKGNTKAVRAKDAATTATEANVVWKTATDSTIFPAKFTIDYGTTNVLGTDGHQHRGKLIVEASDYITTEGAVYNVSFDNWYVDDVLVAGKQEIKNAGRDSLEHCIFDVTVTDGKLTFAESSLAYTEHTQRVWVAGEDNIAAVAQFQYSITGDQKGTVDTLDYTANVTADDPILLTVSASLPESGTMHMTIDSDALKYVMPEFADMLKAIYPDDFYFDLVFVGNNKAKIRYTIINALTGDEMEQETDEFDLTQYM